MLNNLKGQYLAMSPLQRKLFPILPSDIPKIVQLAKRRLCSVTMTLGSKISSVLIGIFDALLGISDPFITMSPKINS